MSLAMSLRRRQIVLIALIAVAGTILSSISLYPHHEHRRLLFAILANRLIATS
jgi:hypothetical protein